MSYTVNINRPVQVEATSKRIGVAEGKFVVPDDFDDCNAEIAEIIPILLARRAQKDANK